MAGMACNANQHDINITLRARARARGTALDLDMELALAHHDQLEPEVDPFQDPIERSLHHLDSGWEEELELMRWETT